MSCAEESGHFYLKCTNIPLLSAPKTLSLNFFIAAFFNVIPRLTLESFCSNFSASFVYLELALEKVNSFIASDPIKVFFVNKLLVNGAVYVIRHRCNAAATGPSNKLSVQEIFSR